MKKKLSLVKFYRWLAAHNGLENLYEKDTLKTSLFDTQKSYQIKSI